MKRIIRERLRELGEGMVVLLGLQQVQAVETSEGPEAAVGRPEAAT
jgi:hypothetical protein